MFKVNNKFTVKNIVSVVNFEQVNTHWGDNMMPH